MRGTWLVGVMLAALAVVRPAAADEKIVYATDWKAEAEHGGFYQAVATGLYKKRGLDVTIHEGGPGIDNQQLIAAGAVTMATGSNDFYLLNLIQAGAPVRAVMTAFQKDPQVLMTHPRSDIKSLADMKGKPIMIADFVDQHVLGLAEGEIRIRGQPNSQIYLQHGPMAGGQERNPAGLSVRRAVRRDEGRGDAAGIPARG